HLPSDLTQRRRAPSRTRVSGRATAGPAPIRQWQPSSPVSSPPPPPLPSVSSISPAAPDELAGRASSQVHSEQPSPSVLFPSSHSSSHSGWPLPHSWGGLSRRATASSAQPPPGASTEPSRRG